MPDVVLCWQHGTFGAVSYRDLQVRDSTTRFIEDGWVPSDAAVVDRTWRYVNKSGGPDRRFNNNAQLPVVKYGVLYLSSATGLNIHLNSFERNFEPCVCELLAGTPEPTFRVAATEIVVHSARGRYSRWSPGAGASHSRSVRWCYTPGDLHGVPASSPDVPSR